MAETKDAWMEKWVIPEGGEGKGQGTHRGDFLEEEEWVLVKQQW